MWFVDLKLRYYMNGGLQIWEKQLGFGRGIYFPGRKIAGRVLKEEISRSLLEIQTDSSRKSQKQEYELSLFSS